MRKIHFIIFFSGLFFQTHSYAQSRITLTGKVTDARTGEILPGASVYFPDLRTGAVCNNDGMYVISNFFAGKYLVEVSYLGYTSVIEVVEAGHNTRKDFKLDPTVVENEMVTVTGVSSATSTRRTSIPVNIIKKENLFNNVSTNLVDNLAKTPGLAQVTTGPGISKPFIRGLGYNRVVVVNDGIRQEGQQWGDEHGIEIDELNASRVEILKGPASLMYGSDALAGVVNIISIQPAPEGYLKGNIMGAWQTNNRQRNLHADFGGNNNGFIWGINGSYKAAADYKNKNDGYVFNSRFNEKNFGAYIGLNRRWGFIHLYMSKYDQHPGLVEGNRDSLTGRFLKEVNYGGVVQEETATTADSRSSTPSIPRQRIQHFKIAADNSFHIGKNRLTMVLGYQQNQRQEFGNILDPGEKELFFDLGTVNYNLQYQLAEKKNGRTAFGISGMQQTNKNRGEEQLIPEYGLFDFGGFVYTRKTINKLTLSGGLRFDNRSLNSKELVDGTQLKFAAFNKNFSNLTGSAGLSYEAGSIVTLKFNLARGFRAPNITELSANGVHEGSFRYLYGDQQLRSETSLQADAGFIANTDHISFQLNVFSNSIQHFIFLHKLTSFAGGDSVITLDGNDYSAFRYGQNNARLSGFEFNLDIHPHPHDWLHFENTFSWVRGVLSQPEDGSKNIPFIPAARLISEVKVNFLNKGTLFKNWFVLAELDNTFAQHNPFTGFNTETKTAGYSLFNMGLGGDITNKGKTIASLFLAANNITDVAWQSHLSRLKYAPENPVTGRMGIFNMGRTFTLKMNIPLNIKSKEK